MRRIGKFFEFSHLVELLGVISLVVGIVLVILQLQQNEELIRFQIATELRVNRDNDRNVTRGEQYSTTLAKIQTKPDSLTDAELIEFDAHAMSLVSELDLRRSLTEVGIFQADWKTWLRAETCNMLNNPIGRQWLDYKTNGVDQQLVDQQIIDELAQRLTLCEGFPSFLETVRDQL